MKAQSNAEAVIDRSLRTAVLIDSFWERWLVHGLPAHEIDLHRKKLATAQIWKECWLSAAGRLEQAALQLAEQHMAGAEGKLRAASLAYNLAHWIYPDRQPDKIQAYEACIRVFKQADALSKTETRYAELEIDGLACPGRIRVPARPVGCVIIINPIDSTKEELYTYEADFIKDRFVTVSFDGPGQGEAYTLHGLKGTKDRWEAFMKRVIEYAAGQFPGLPIHLFGTSLGASWAIYGSCHPLVHKTAAVSPAVEFERLRLPSYFLDRMDYSCTLVPGQRAIPDFERLAFRSPVMLFHGKKDQMVPSSDMYRLYLRLPAGKQLLEYPEEGHCCNYRLSEIRKEASLWFTADTKGAQA